MQAMGEGETVGSQKRQKTGVESEVRTDEKVALDSPSGDVSLPISSDVPQILTKMRSFRKKNQRFWGG